jgi:hypothetical protein
MTTTKRASTKRRRVSPAQAEQARQRTEAFRTLALQLEGELKEGRHEQRLAKAQKEVPGIERYSPLNQLLILAQCPHVTEVHGYVEWQELGYQVRKGETAISIRAPHTKKPEEGSEETAGKVGFHRASVFDRSQVGPVNSAEATEAAASQRSYLEAIHEAAEQGEDQDDQEEPEETATTTTAETTGAAE